MSWKSSVRDLLRWNFVTKVYLLSLHLYLPFIITAIELGLNDVPSYQIYKHVSVVGASSNKPSSVTLDAIRDQLTSVLPWSSNTDAILLVIIMQLYAALMDPTLPMLHPTPRKSFVSSSKVMQTQ